MQEPAPSILCLLPYCVHVTCTLAVDEEPSTAAEEHDGRPSTTDGSAAVDPHTGWFTLVIEHAPKPVCPVTRHASPSVPTRLMLPLGRATVTLQLCVPNCTDPPGQT